MDKKVLRSYSFIRAGNIDEEKLIIEHTINTKALDRYGTVVLPKGAKVKNFLKNPVVLWCHNVDGKAIKIPIAKCLELTIEDDSIKTKTQFNANDELAVKVFNSCKDGFLNAWSIGFMPLEYIRVTEENQDELNAKYGLNLKLKKKDFETNYWGYYIIPSWELYEYSVVPVPGNPEALTDKAKETEYARELVTRGLLEEKDVLKFSAKPNRKEDAMDNKEEAPKEEKKEVTPKEEKKEVKPEDTKEVVAPVEEEKKVEDAPKKEITPEPKPAEKAKVEDAPKEKVAEKPKEVKKEATENKDLEAAPKVEVEAPAKTEDAPKKEITEEKPSKTEVKVELNLEVIDDKVKSLIKIVDERFKKIEEDLAKVLEKAESAVTKEDLKAVKDGIADVQKSLDVDNIDKLREIEASQEDPDASQPGWAKKLLKKQLG